MKTVIRKYAKEVKIGDKIAFPSEGWVEVKNVRQLSGSQSLAPCVRQIEIDFSDGETEQYNAHDVFEHVYTDL